MSKKNEHHFKYIQNDFKDLRENESWLLNGHELKFWGLAYYPIAIVEVDLTVQAKEEFIAIEKLILSLLNMNIKSVQQIAKITGFTERYIEKIYLLLAGTGHIYENGITDLGKESLKEECKILKTESKEKLLVDAINHVILTKDFKDYPTTLKTKELTNNNTPHIEHNLVADYDLLQALKEDFRKYKNTDKKLVDHNVEAINNAVTKEIKYAPVYLAEFSGIDYPIIFTKGIYNRADLDKNFHFRPIAIQSSLSHLIPKFWDLYRDSITVVDDNSMQQVSQLISSIRDNQQEKDDFEETLFAVVAKYMKGEVDSSKFEMRKSGSAYYINPNLSNELRYADFVRNCKNLNIKGASEQPYLDYLKYAPSHNGTIVYLETDDSMLANLYDFLLAFSKSHICYVEDVEAKYIEFCKDWPISLPYNTVLEFLKDLDWVRLDE